MMRVVPNRSWGYAVVIVATAALAASNLARAELNPAMLFHQLLTDPVGPAGIPHGLSAPTVSRFSLSANGKKHHALGAVQLVFKGKSYPSVIYEVFPNHRDAVDDLAATPGYPGDVLSAAPSFVPKPSRTINNATVGVSGITFVDGNVLVLASAASASTKADLAAAIDMSKFALSYLLRTRASESGAAGRR